MELRKKLVLNVFYFIEISILSCFYMFWQSYLNKKKKNFSHIHLREILSPFIKTNARPIQLHDNISQTSDGLLTQNKQLLRSIVQIFPKLQMFKLVKVSVQHPTILHCFPPSTPSPDLTKIYLLGYPDKK